MTFFYQLALMRLMFCLLWSLKSKVWWPGTYLPVQTADVMMFDGVEVLEVVDEVALQHERGGVDEA